MFESTLRTLIVIIFLSAVILFTSLIRNDNNSQSQADLNTPLPEFTLRTLHLEKKITNEDLEDLFVLNVWASWCITCRVEHPFLEEISKTTTPPSSSTVFTFDEIVYSGSDSLRYFLLGYKNFPKNISKPYCCNKFPSISQVLGAVFIAVTLPNFNAICKL